MSRLPPDYDPDLPRRPPCFVDKHASLLGYTIVGVVLAAIAVTIVG